MRKTKSELDKFKLYPETDHAIDSDRSTCRGCALKRHCDDEGFCHGCWWIESNPAALALIEETEARNAKIGVS